MGLLKKIFDIFYHSKPILMCRESAARRIDRRLAPILSEVHNLKNTQQKILQQQIDLHVKQAKELGEIHNQIDGRLVRSIQVSQLSDWRLKVLTERQESIANINSLDSLRHDFEQVLNKIFVNEPHYNHAYSPLILLDLIRNYMFDGGTWLLKQEINSFLNESDKKIIAPILPTIPTNRPLKILVISGLFPAIEHGGGLRLFDIIQGLSSEHDVDLYTVYDEEKDSHSLELLKNHVQDLWCVASEQIEDQQTTQADITEWLESISKHEQYYDIIQLEYPHTIFLTNFVKQYGKKVGFTFMECMTKSNVIKIQDMLTSNDLGEMSKFANSFWKHAVAEKFVLENADFLIAVTSEDANFLQRLNSRLPFIVPTCLSQLEIIDKAAKSTVVAEKGCVAFLGFFGHYPNIDSMKWYLSKIHPLIKERVPEYKFLIIGAGDTTPLKELAANDHQVEFSGRVDDVIPHIQRASVCVLPLNTGAGIRGKLNQYSIAGRPSVSTSIGNKGLDYEHDKSVLIANKSEDFAEAVIELLTNQRKNLDIAGKAKKHALKNFTWDKHLKTLVNIYRGIPETPK